MKRLVDYINFSHIGISKLQCSSLLERSSQFLYIQLGRSSTVYLSLHTKYNMDITFFELIKLQIPKSCRILSTIQEVRDFAFISAGTTPMLRGGEA